MCAHTYTCSSSSEFYNLATKILRPSNIIIIRLGCRWPSSLFSRPMNSYPSGYMSQPVNSWVQSQGTALCISLLQVSRAPLRSIGWRVNLCPSGTPRTLPYCPPSQCPGVTPLPTHVPLSHALSVYAVVYHQHLFAASVMWLGRVTQLRLGPRC